MQREIQRSFTSRPAGGTYCCTAIFLCLIVAQLGCSRSDSFPSRPITIICPWAAGGGTDRVSRQMAMHLEQELGQPVNVVNATGGKGVTGHNRGLSARPDGYTLTMITLELNTMHWTGLTELTFKDCVPLVSLNEDYAALLVRDDSPWQSLDEVEADVRAAPKKFTASGTAIGGAWHLALAGWLIAAGAEADDIIWVPSEGANPSLQQLLSGGVDMVCCSLPEARTLLEAGQVRALGVMSPERAVGFEDVKTFREQGRDWTLGGWRGLAVPKDSPSEIVDQLVEAVQNIVSQDAREGSFAGFMETQKFDHTWRGPVDFVAFLDETDQKLGKLLTSEAMKSVSNDRFSPMAYPYILMGLIALTLAAMGIGLRRARSLSASPVSELAASVTRTGAINFAVVVLSIVAYVLFAETIGFVILAAGILLVLLLHMGTRALPSMIIVITFVPAIYFVFAHVLRVPLPRGWLG